jgi:ribosomal protein S18 acetylase RimI-like enzyme
MALRFATKSDADSVARLLVQLYQTEAPIMIGERPEPYATLIRHCLLIDDAAALRNCYVMEHDGTVVALGGVATREMPRRNLVYDGMIRDAVRSVGLTATARWLWGRGRLMAALLAELEEPEAQLHSIVVDNTSRRRGLGAQMLQFLEHEAAELGKSTSVLHVLNGNPAEHFYKRYGYEVRDAASESRSRLAYPGVVMVRPLERHARPAASEASGRLLRGAQHR